MGQIRGSGVVTDNIMTKFPYLDTRAGNQLHILRLIMRYPVILLMSAPGLFPSAVLLSLSSLLMYNFVKKWSKSGQIREVVGGKMIK